VGNFALGLTVGATICIVSTGITLMATGDLSLGGSTVAELPLTNKNDGAKAPPEIAGFIHVDSPEIYTRERLVNDRYQQDTWLRGRLDKSNEIEHGLEGIRSRSVADQAFGALNVGVKATGPSNVIPAGEDESNDVPRVDAPELQRLKAQDEPGGVVPQLAAQPSPIADFNDRTAYRELVRNAIIENQLDDRHDLDGNTLYRLKFDATVFPTRDNSHWAMLDVRITPRLQKIKLPDYDQRAPRSERMKIVREALIEAEPELVKQWLRYYRNKYIQGLSHSLTTRFRSRIIDLRAVLYGEVSHEKLTGELKQDFLDLRTNYERGILLQFEREFDYSGSKEEFREHNQLLVNELKVSCGIASQPTFVGLRESAFNTREATCLIERAAERFSKRYYWVTRATFADRVISSTLAGTYQNDRSGGSASTIDERHVDTDGQGVDVISQEEPVILFDSNDPVDFDGNPVPLDVNDKRFCRDTHPAVFEVVDRKLVEHSYLDKLQPRQIGRLVSSSEPEFSDDGRVKCFDYYLDIVQEAGFFSFIEAISNNTEQPVYSYAVTPKEAVQRLSDRSQQSRAAAALAALAINTGIADADASAKIMREYQESVEAISRHPLVVGFSRGLVPDDKDSDTLGFGWIIGPRLHSGQNGVEPKLRQVLTQRSLSALISIPAWWPSINIAIEAKWIDENGIPVGTPTTITHADVRLPVDVDEIQRGLYPNQSKRPQIDRHMDPVVLRLPPAEKAPQSFRILIPGENLWRSTVVTLGTDVARQIWVMPDMHGIVAEFSNFPGRHLEDPDYLPLRVWTSDGVDLVRNKVCVVPHGHPARGACNARNQVGNFVLTGTLAASAIPSARSGNPVTSVHFPDPPTISSDPRLVASAPRPDAPAAALSLARDLDDKVRAATDKLDSLLDLNTTTPEAVRSALDATTKVKVLADSFSGLHAPGNPIAQQAAADADIATKLLEESISSEANDTPQLTQEAQSRIRKLRSRLELLQDETAEATQRLAFYDQVDALTPVASSPDGNWIAARDGMIEISLQSPGLASIARVHTLSVGLSPEIDGIVEEPRFMTPVDNPETAISAGVLTVSIRLPSTPTNTLIGNGTKVLPTLRVTSQSDNFVFVRDVLAQNSLVHYAAPERARLYVTGSGLRLDRKTLATEFTMRFPGNSEHAYPDMFDSEPIATAHINDGEKQTRLGTNIHPVDSSRLLDLTKPEEIALRVLLKLDEDQRPLIEKHFAKQGQIDVAISFDPHRPAEQPKVDGQLTIIGFSEVAKN
jgi:hypothetical protein